jgi:hypothetical protein
MLNNVPAVKHSCSTWVSAIRLLLARVLTSQGACSRAMCTPDAAAPPPPTAADVVDVEEPPPGLLPVSPPGTIAPASARLLPADERDRQLVPQEHCPDNTWVNDKA